jgi:hypothetical protein
VLARNSLPLPLRGGAQGCLLRSTRWGRRQSRALCPGSMSRRLHRRVVVPCADLALRCRGRWLAGLRSFFARVSAVFCVTLSLGGCNRSWRRGHSAKGAPPITIETASCSALGRLSPVVLLAHPGARPTPEAQTSPLASATQGFKQHFSPSSLGPMSPAAAEVKISTTQRHAPATR